MFRAVFCLLLLLGADSINAQEIKAYSISIGTLERLESPKSGYVFHSSEGEEILDYSESNYLTSKKVEMHFHGISGLKEIGFKLDNGVEYIYRTLKLAEYPAAQLASQQHPGHKAIAMIFEGEAKTRLEILISGKTPVMRADLQLDGKTVTLWSSRKDEVPKK